MANVIENTIDTEAIPNEISDQVKNLTRIVADVTVEMNNMRRFVSIPVEKNIHPTERFTAREADYRAIISEVIPERKPESPAPVTRGDTIKSDVHDQKEERIIITEDMRVSLISQIDNLKEKYGKGAITRIADETGIPMSQISKLYKNKTKTLTHNQIDILMNLI